VDFYPNDGEEHFFYCAGSAPTPMQSRPISGNIAQHVAAPKTSYIAPAIKVVQPVQSSSVKLNLSSLSTWPSSTPANKKENVSTQGHSTASKAGIGVGVSIGLILIIAVTSLYLWRRQNRKEKQSEPNWEKAELDARALDRSKCRPEMMGNEVYEMEASAHQPIEIMDDPRPEMDTVRDMDAIKADEVHVASDTLVGASAAVSKK
jgi:hypothetical protein